MAALRVSVAFLAALLLTLVSGSCLQSPAAPAPLERRAARQTQWLAGRWVMHWATVRYDATFSPGGGYLCVGHGRAWVGTWRVEGHRLTVHERVSEAEPGSEYEFGLPLDENLSGVIDRGSCRGIRIRLSRPCPTD